MSQRQRTNVKFSLSAPETLADAVALFQAHHVSRLSPQTATWYQYRLDRFVAYFGEETPLSAIQPWQIELWFSSLFDEQELHANNPFRNNEKTSYSLYTIHGHGRAVKKLFNWLRKIKILPDNPAEDLELPRLKNKPREGIPPEHLAKLIASLSASQNKNACRDKAIILLLSTTGVRVGGAASLQRCDVDLEKRVAVVTEKGDKTRHVFFTDETAQAIKEYHAVSPSHPSLFTSEWKGQTKGITTEGIRLMIARRCKEFGIPRYSPHDFRRYFAATAVAAGCDIHWLQQILGHESVTTTEIYVTQNTTILQGKYDKLFGGSDSRIELEKRVS